MTSRPILYADDDENDVFLMQRAFSKAGVVNPLCTVQDGREAVDYLAGSGRFADREQHPLPCLMLLDLNMPGKSGLDVLKWLRAQPVTATLPVVVFTSSNQESDIHRAYSLGANGYLVKPGKPDELLTMVKGIKDFWLAQNRVTSGFGGLSSESLLA
jgi:CheY-like chemotaxis protein